MAKCRRIYQLENAQSVDINFNLIIFLKTVSHFTTGACVGDVVTDAVVVFNVELMFIFVDSILNFETFTIFKRYINWAKTNSNHSKLINKINMPKICVKAPEIVMSGE